jgi:hypothetical protein
MPTKADVRERARRRRRARGQKERAPTWDENGNRFCPRCREAFPLSQISRSGCYCVPCLRAHKFEYKLRTKYGLTLDEYDLMVLKSEGRCQICEEPNPRLDIDHCHATGKVRGLLCIRCNYQLLGVVQDDSAILRRAVEYLEQL